MQVCIMKFLSIVQPCLNFKAVLLIQVILEIFMEVARKILYEQIKTREKCYQFV